MRISRRWSGRWSRPARDAGNCGSTPGEGLNEALDNQDIAARVGVSPGQGATVKADVGMGTYGDAGGAADAGALEAGLAIGDDNNELAVPSERIDITAQVEMALLSLSN